MTGADRSPTVAAVADHIAQELCEPIYSLGELEQVAVDDDTVVLHDVGGRYEITVRRRPTP